MRATSTTQISAFLENTPGVVARLCDALLEDDIDIRAMTVLDTVDVGTMRMVVDDVEKAKASLTKAGAAYVEVPVLSVELENEPGAFALVARKLAAHNINIDYFYTTAAKDTDHTLAIFRVSDAEAAQDIDFEATA